MTALFPPLVRLLRRSDWCRMKIEVQGNPSEDEVAAIIAAIEMSWPQPAPVISAAPTQGTTWRYAGRWWQEGRLPPRWNG